MKKIISIVLCFVLALTMLTGCGDAEQTRQVIKEIAEAADEYAAAGYFDGATASEGTSSDEFVAELINEITSAYIRSALGVSDTSAGTEETAAGIESAGTAAGIERTETASDTESTGTASGIEDVKAAAGETGGDFPIVSGDPEIMVIAGTDEETGDAAGYKDGKYPVNWKLEDIYADEEAWYRDYDRALKLTDKLSDFKGKLNTAQGIYDLTSFFMDGEYSAITDKLSLYANCRSSLNGADRTAMDMSAKLSQLGIKASQAVSYADEEIFSMSLAERKKIFSDPILEKYAYALKDYTDEDTVHYSEETVSALAISGSAGGAGYDIFTTLYYVDLPVPEIIMPDGSTAQLTEETYGQILSGDYSRDFKLEAAEKYCGRIAPYANTFAKTLEYTIRENVAEAQLNGYDSYAEYAFYTADVEPEIYEKMKTAVHEMLPDYHKYLAYRKQHSGYDHFYSFDIAASQDGYDGAVTYDESCEKMLRALSILGDDYTDAVSSVIEGGHVDVYPKAGKTMGGFETSCHNRDILPYILLNYTGDMGSTTTLCHEMGHAMYDYFSTGNSELNATNCAPSIFTHEVASINNEFLLAYDGIDSAQSEDEKRAYLDSAISLIQGSVIRQMMYAEFEEYLYDTVEGGGALDAETVSDKWVELSREYYGEGVEFIDSYRYRWAEIPHFYFGYYVYKYATSCTYAAAASRNIYDGKKGALEKYRKFLTLGGSDKPSELLKAAGVDPLNDKSYDYIKEVFAGFINEYCGIR